jgi:hypothetical protein
MTARAAKLAVLVAAALTALPADDGVKLVAQQASDSTAPAAAAWAEVEWPFPTDQWGRGRAFTCAAARCGARVELYLRPKLGFCNCTAGVSDDAELDRVGDLELLSATFNPLGDGRTIAVGWMSGRSRPYQVAVPFAAPRTALAIAFNDKCDVVVATVVAERGFLGAAERAALKFLNGDLALRWVEQELGL